MRAPALTSAKVVVRLEAATRRSTEDGRPQNDLGNDSKDVCVVVIVRNVVVKVLEFRITQRETERKRKKPLFVDCRNGFCRTTTENHLYYVCNNNFVM